MISGPDIDNLPEISGEQHNKEIPWILGRAILRALNANLRSKDITHHHARNNPRLDAKKGHR